jgi:hypothetical protein
MNVQITLTDYRFVTTPVGVEIFCTRHLGPDDHYQATEIVDNLSQAIEFAKGHEVVCHTVTL